MKSRLDDVLDDEEEEEEEESLGWALRERHGWNMESASLVSCCWAHLLTTGAAADGAAAAAAFAAAWRYVVDASLEPVDGSLSQEGDPEEEEKEGERRYRHPHHVFPLHQP